MGNIFFVSDTHFNQQRTLEMSKRPFKDVKEMNRVMVNNWNKVVKPGDVVYHLGDFGDYRIREFLNGDIVLVKGNYERNLLKEELEEHKHYFKEIHEYYHAIVLDNYNIKMTHEPHRLKDTFIDKNNINIFGHTHKLCMIKPYGVNVSVDCHYFTPIDLETVLFYHNGILNYYDNDVFY